MWLWDKPKAVLCYGLLDTPEKLIEAEYKRLLYSFCGTEEQYEQGCAEIRKNHIYTDIPNSEKTKVFTLDRSEEDIENMKTRIVDCRKFLNDVLAGNIEPEDNEEESSE